MKIVLLVCNEAYYGRLLSLLGEVGIDYYTRWDKVTGRGHDTEPHLGTRSFPGYNSALMIAFREEEPLERLVDRIVDANQHIQRPDDKIRLFQVPLERII